VVILLSGFSVNLDESFYIYPLVAALPRHDLVDVLISKPRISLREVLLSGIVAISSPRRALDPEIAVHRPDFHATDVRGNVPHPNREVSDRGFVEFALSSVSPRLVADSSGLIR
jgi:hypothetical protein